MNAQLFVRFCLGPFGSFLGGRVIIRFDLTFLEGATPQLLVSLYPKCIKFLLPEDLLDNEGAGGIVFFSRTGKKKEEEKKYCEGGTGVGGFRRG